MSSLNEIEAQMAELQKKKDQLLKEAEEAQQFVEKVKSAGFLQKSDIEIFMKEITTSQVSSTT